MSINTDFSSGNAAASAPLAVRTMNQNWRVGSKVPLNVYEGDRPVCQCHTEDDARRIVAAMLEADAISAELQQAKAQIQQDSIDLNITLDVLSERNAELAAEREDNAAANRRWAASQQEARELRAENEKMTQEMRVDIAREIEDYTNARACFNPEHGADLAELANLREKAMKWDRARRSAQNCAKFSGIAKF